MNTLDKNKVLALRHHGKSINEISKRLNVPKSTVSLWCKNIKLNLKQINVLKNKQASGSAKGRKKFLTKLREERMNEIKILRKLGIEEVGELNKRDLFIAGIAMYWSEGYTYSGGNQVGFVNSDARIILLMLRWFKKICFVKNNDITFQIKINKIHKYRINRIESYWSKTTNISLNQFNKTVFINSKVKKIYPNPEDYYGTLRITIRKGTKLRRKINGWIEGLAKFI